MSLNGSAAQHRALILQGNPGRTASIPRRITLVLLGSALLALCSHIAIPRLFTPVPVTMQTFALFLLAGTLGPTAAASAVCAYFFEGLLGVPVFAPPLSGNGIAHLFGPTGGYLLGYLPAVFIFSFLYNKMRAQVGTFGSALAAGVLAETPIFVLGTAWLAIYLHRPLQVTSLIATTPFLPGEAAKLVFMACFLAGLTRVRRGSRPLANQ